MTGLADAKGKEKIAQRIARVQSGLFGDAKYFDGIGELRRTLVLLIGGNKKSQRRDIKKAVGLAKEV